MFTFSAEGYGFCTVLNFLQQTVSLVSLIKLNPPKLKQQAEEEEEAASEGAPSKRSLVVFFCSVLCEHCILVHYTVLIVVFGSVLWAFFMFTLYLSLSFSQRRFICIVVSLVIASSALLTSSVQVVRGIGRFRLCNLTVVLPFAASGSPPQKVLLIVEATTTTSSNTSGYYSFFSLLSLSLFVFIFFFLFLPIVQVLLACSTTQRQQHQHS